VLVETVKAKMAETSGNALNIGSIICSCVSTQKGTILKAIIVDFLNLLTIKSYRHSLFFLCQTSYLSSVYFVNQPPHVSAIFVAHHQEVYWIYTKTGMCCDF